ncbi:DUF1634 domain-containing protein [Lacrimispora sp. JR3]|uniref:DUF1634 domain-containing protein n=1 Tax=Lacrimispora sinapis TaxID=3111456 RepID=UPI003747CAD0
MSKNVENYKNVEEAEIWISKTLRAGVVLSAVITGFGLVLFLLTGNSGYPGESFPTSLVGIMEGLLAFKPYAIILSGLLVLILTPVLRVGVSIITFLKEKDHLYAMITATVFVILIISFFMGK